MRNSIKLMSVALLTAGALALAKAQYHVRNLVSDGTVAADHIDPNLANAWGIAMSPTGPFWIADNHTGLSTVYDSTGTPYPPGNPLIVSIPPAGASAPTGIVYNGGTGFMVSKGGNSGPARFIFVTEDGTISGWNPSVDAANAVQTGAKLNAVYKGLAINQEGTRIYATNFHDALIDVYDSNWNLVDALKDKNMPKGYAPFGIRMFGNDLMVTYAKQNKERHDDDPGPGNGYVDVFGAGQHRARRLISRGALNSPWGLAIAPANFGSFSNALLVGNFGDGWINAYDPSNGSLLGYLTDESRSPIVEDGLWALTFGNGSLGGDANKLYFTAGPDHEDHGLFGSISAP